MGFLTHAMVDLIGIMPESLIWRFARRYIAGSTLSDGLAEATELLNGGYATTLDVLGEDISQDREADQALENYRRLVEALSEKDLIRNISLKLSQFGLKLNANAMESRIFSLVDWAREHDCFVRIDMEDSSTTTRTIDLYRTIRKRYDRVGTVIQACLRRSIDDVATLQKEGATNLRICKGIYIEDSSIAYRDYQEVRDNYMKLVRQMFDGGSFIGLATHDDWLIDQCLLEIRRRGFASDRYEFQMLLGVGEHLRKDLIREGHCVRVYIPFGEAWKAYSLRRFRENPKIAWYVIKNLLRFA